VQSRDTAPRLLMSAFAAVAAAIIAACATTVQQEIANEPPTSVETLSYYPFQVKGYQNSYPRRRVLVLLPLDSRDFKDVCVEFQFRRQLGSEISRCNAAARNMSQVLRLAVGVCRSFQPA
jgi:hypothetical protein